MEYNSLMSYKEKPQLKLYAFTDNQFVLQAIIDDYQECSFEHNIYQAGQFTISINYNIPNSQLFQRGLFIQFGNNPYDFGEIYSIQDSIGEDGKGSQIRTISGYDARYILKRRVIKNMNSNGLWVMTAKGELCLRNLIKDQCGSGAEEKRQLPIENIIPADEEAIGKNYSVSEQFTNLYEVCRTIATQSEIGWRIAFNGTLSLECFSGTDRSQTVQFSTSFDSLANGEFSDSSESFSNAIYIGGKGQNDNRDIYEGEDGTPSGFDRFESWDNQSQMTTESEYEAEALSMLSQYGQTLTMAGNGLAKCPYIFREQYDIGDIIKVAFSGKSANAQILSVTEHWAWGNYDIQFSFGKPQPNLAEQLQLMLRKIQSASNKTNSTDSVRWYTIPTDTEMPKADVTYNTIGFIGTCASGGSTFKLYLDNEKTGAKTYHVYFKQLGGGNLTLTTGKSGATNLVMNSGTYVAIIYVDENGNVTSQGATATNTIQAGNYQPATSGGVFNLLKNQKTYEFFTPDYIRYVLMQDVSTWYNSTSSSTVQTWSMNGMLVAKRTDGYDRSEVVNLTLSVGYYRNNQSLPNPNIMHVNSFCLNNLIQACIVRYNSKEYLALKILENQSRNYYFIGYCESTPLFTTVTTSQTVEVLYNGGRTITDGVNQNSGDLITSGAIFYLRQGLFYDSRLLELADNQEKTVALDSSRMYLFVNIDANSGQELIILNCYNGVLRQTRLTHAYDGYDTVITNSGQNVTFKSTGGCRGHLLYLTDYSST